MKEGLVDEEEEFGKIILQNGKKVKRSTPFMELLAKLTDRTAQAIDYYKYLDFLDDFLLDGE
jgi:hypothetical protein